MARNGATAAGLTRFLSADHHSSLLSGHVSSAVELLEGVYTRPDAIPSSMSFVFRKLLEEGNEEALDKCKTKLSLWGLYSHNTPWLENETCPCCVPVGAMAERLANHFACYRPASDLFLQLLDNDKVEDAKFLLVVSTRVLRPPSRNAGDLCSAEFYTLI